MKSFLLSLFLMTSCYKNQKTSSILGNWVLTNSQINYPEIQFNLDSSAIFYSYGDTIYRYKYYVQNNFLYLIDFEQNKTRFKIEKLDNIHLVFSNFLEQKEKQIYAKTE
jgi:hypothetical protein